MSFVAAASCRAITAALSESSFSSAEPFSKSSFSFASCVASCSTSALILVRSFCAARSIFSPCATAWRFGLTVLATP